MNFLNKKSDSQKKVLIKLKIKEIFPLKEDIKNLLTECLLKFKDTNNNKYNIYNLSYMLNNTIILIPANTNKIDQLEINLIIDNIKFISKGILYLNKNADEQIVKFNIIDNYINIKFNYNLNFMNINNENKIRKRESFKKPKVSTNNRNSIKNFSNELYNGNTLNKIVNIKQKLKIKLKSKSKNKKNNNNCEVCQSDRKNSIHFNVNKSQIIFPCNLIINNNNNREFNFNNNKNNNNYSEIWINDTKMFIKKIRNYITLRNSRNNSRQDFKKCLSAKDIYSYMDYTNKVTNSKSKKKKSKKHINTNSSNSSTDTQGNFLSNIKKNSTGKKLNHSMTNFQDNSQSKKENSKYSNLTTVPKDNNKINYKISNEVKNKLFKNCMSINIEKKNKNDKILFIEKEKNCNLEEKEVDINKMQIHEDNNNNLYKKKIVNNIYSKKINFSPIKLSDINPINKIEIDKPNEEMKQKNIKNIIYTNEENNLSSQGKTKINKKENSNISTFNDFFKLKNDLYLVYNNKYINNIKKELLKLEFELFVEKTIELMNEYHKSIDSEKDIYKFLLKSFKNYKSLYHIYSKKIKKLEKIKEIKKNKIDKININNYDLLIHKKEISIFEYIFKNNEQSKNNCVKNESKTLSKLLKNILIKILINKNDKDYLNHFGKYNNWINNNIIKNKDVLNINNEIYN